MNYFVRIIIDAYSTVNNENPISSEGVKHWTKSFSHENSLVASTSIRFSVDRRSHPFERVLRCNRSNHRNSPAFDEFPSSFARKCSYVNSFVTDRAWMPRFQDIRSIASTGTHTRARAHTHTHNVSNHEQRTGILFGRTAKAFRRIFLLPEQCVPFRAISCVTFFVFRLALPFFNWIWMQRRFGIRVSWLVKSSIVAVKVVDNLVEFNIEGSYEKLHTSNSNKKF